MKHRHLGLLMMALGVLLATVPVAAQTPDGETPAEEQACDKYQGEGARYGLCVAYCGFMIYGGAIFVDALMTLGNNARDVPLPRWLLTSILPIGFALLAVRFLQVGWRLLSDRAAVSGFGERETGRSVRGE